LGALPYDDIMTIDQMAAACQLEFAAIHEKIDKLAAESSSIREEMKKYATKEDLAKGLLSVETTLLRRFDDFETRMFDWMRGIDRRVTALELQCGKHV